MAPIALRPRSSTEIIDASFRLYRAHFATLATIAAVFVVPPAVVAALVPPTVAPLVTVLGNFLYPLLLGATIAAVAMALDGEPVGVERALAQLRGRIGRLIGITIVSGLLVTLGAVLLLIPGIVAFVFTAVAPAVAMLESPDGVGASIRRSRELARGEWKQVLATMGLTMLLMLVIVVAGALGVGMVVGVLGGGDRMSELASTVAVVVGYPIIGVATALLYYDLRIRREGFDIERMAEALGPAA